MKNLFLFITMCAVLSSCTQPKPEPAVAVAETKPQPLEFGDAKYIDICKQALRSLAEGNVDGFTSTLAENVKLTWNYGDSLMGKQAVSDYWKERRGKVIDTLTFSNEVWLTVNANEPPAPNVPTGTWVFAWYKATAKYTSTGKSMTQWIHQLQHFDANGKIDFLSQYLDRVPIMAANKK